MRSLKGWALAPTKTGATETGARGRRGRIAGAAITALLAAALVPGFAAPASADISGNGVGPLAANGFPAWFSDGTTKLALCDNGPANGCVVDLAADGEAFWFNAAASSAAHPALYEIGLEATTAPGNVSFSRLRFRLLDGLTPGASYRIQHPYGVNTFVAIARNPQAPLNGSINETIDLGCDPCTTLADFATVGANFAGNYAAGFRPTFLTQSNRTAGFLGNIAAPGTVTGAPTGLNAVIVTGPNADGAGGNTLTVSDFAVQGRIDSTSLSPIVAPNAPISLIATAGNGSVRANWTVPGNGGAALQIYHVRVVDAATGLKVFKLQDIAAPAGFAPVTLNMTGLPNGIAFRTQVQAKNVAVAGLGAVSNHSNAVTPATVPSRPTIRIATAGIASGTGNWAAAPNGGAVIIRYHVRVVDAATGRRVFVLRDVPGSARSLTVGLPRGIALRFQVQAINRVGPSLLSNPSNAVTAR